MNTYACRHCRAHGSDVPPFADVMGLLDIAAEAAKIAAEAARVAANT
jgi:hypothetical protein